MSSMGGGAKTLSSIGVSPASASIQSGQTEQFTATATYSDGSTANVSSTATWSPGSGSIASISATGLATGTAAGSTSVTASLNGMSGSAALTVEAVAKTLVSVSVAPANASIEVGATQQFTATANYSDGSTSNVTSNGATWSSSASSIATVSASGLATAVAVGSATVSATYQGQSGSATWTSTPVPVTSVAVSPTSVNLVVGQTAQFAATATYANGTTAAVTSSASWSSGNTSEVTVNSSALATAVGAGPAISVTASFSGFSSSATVNVSPSTSAGVNIPMFHVDQTRSGANLGETILTPANVNPQSFGKLFSQLVDGYVYGQPLLVSNLTMGDGTTHNVLFAATENDSVYAFDADNNSGSNANPLWHVSLLESGETPLTGAPIQPVEGVTSTPAIDLTTNTMYVVSTQTSTATGGTFRLNALDITTGSQKPGSPVPITAQVQGSNATTLTTSCLQRAALLIAYGSVYIGFGACHSGWLLAYDETSLVQTGVFNSSPNLVGEGAYASAGGVWMGGGGPAADGQGNVYIVTGNGPWDGQTAFSDSILKFSQTLQLEDYFTPYVYPYMDCADADLASGGILLIPGSGATPMQALAGGKTGKLYLVDTEDLGHEANNDTGATYTTFFEPDLSSPYAATCTSTGSESGSADINSYEIFGTATYFNGSVYLGVTPTAPVPAPIRQFVYSPGSVTPLAYNSNYTPNDYILEGSYGTTTFISANGSSDAVLWMIDHGDPLQSGSTQTNATLRVYDPSSLSSGELYDSNMAASGADVPGYGIKFTEPIAANGKVYISTGHDLVSTPNPQGELDVYGLK
jgi:Bacterial Ig-like domain (group 2)